MEPVDAVLLLAAVGLAAAAVLRDIAAYDRPAVPRAPRPEKRRRREVVAYQPVAASVEPVHATSVLAAIADVEHDRTSPGRRVVSALVLLTLTLLTASLIGAGIYRGLSGLGK